MSAQTQATFVDWMLSVKGVNIKAAYTEYMSSLRVDIDPYDIMHCVSVSTCVSVQLMKSKLRKREVVNARYIAMHFVKHYCPSLTLVKIGYYFGGRDHSSVIHGLQTFEDMIDTNDADFMRMYHSAAALVQQLFERKAASTQIVVEHEFVR